MKIKFANHTDFSFEHVMKAENNGGRFVTYQYILPRPIIKPTRRLSKVYFIDKHSNPSMYAYKFNWINYLIGWWGLPYGPMFCYNSIRLNKKGGLDVTADVYANLEQNNYNQGFFNMIQTKEKIIHPSKHELKEYTKLFQALVEKQVLKEIPIIGIQLDIEEETNYSTTLIGIRQPLDEMLTKEITTAIYKRFYNRHLFELIDLTLEHEMKDDLIQHGWTIEKKSN